MAGSACQALSDCCSGLYANDSTGFSSCEYLGGCRPEGELCRRETDCCGFNASNKVAPICEIFDADEGIGRCRTLTGANAPAGEVCPSNNSCAPNSSDKVSTSPERESARSGGVPRPGAFDEEKRVPSGKDVCWRLDNSLITKNAV